MRLLYNGHRLRPACHTMLRIVFPVVNRAGYLSRKPYHFVYEMEETGTGKYPLP